MAALAHHVAVAYGFDLPNLRATASGQPQPPVGRDDINALNARHGEEYATCTRAEVLDLVRRNGVDAAAFARAERRATPAHRHRVTFRDPATGIERRLFPAFGSSAVDIVQVVMPAGSSPGDLAPHLTPMEYYLLVEQGVVRVTMGDETYDVGEGDAFYFVGDVPHRFDNIGTGEARYIGVGHGHR
jgi:quercetin dioxygenase-like cupin family protein